MYTNRGNISLTLAVWLAADDYDLVFDPNVYSVTTLLQPIRSIILVRRIKEDKSIKGSVDLADIIPARLGSAVHTAVEVAWLDQRQKAMKALNIPDHIIDRIKINPDVEDDPDAIYIYLEQRSKRDIDGVTISGKYDTVESGRVKDIKTTKVYAWIKGSNNERYRMQGSMYRWLNPDTITDAYMDVEYLFTDWSQWEAKKKGDYPPKRIMTKTLKLMSIADTETYIRGRINSIKKFLPKPQEDLPLCTPSELWMDPPTWAYYRKPTNKNATKLFDNPADAAAMNAAQGSTGVIRKRDSEPTFCKFCDARPICTQAERYEAEGLLKL